MARAQSPESEAEVLLLQARPLLRVLLADNLAKLEFRVQGAFSIQDLTGKLLLRSRKTEQRWLGRVLEGKPAAMLHSVLVASFAEHENATRLAAELEGAGYESRIASIGVPLRFRGGHEQETLRYRVLVGRFQEEAAARDLLTHFQNRFRPRLIKERRTAPTGKVEFTDQDFEHLGECEGGFRIVPRTRQGSVTLLKLPLDSFANAPTEDRDFQGVVEFRVDNRGRLAVVNEVPIDTYLKGVLPSEMDASFPPEAQKAQAVAARSTVLSMLGMKHMNEDWDVCASSHCQQYSGSTHPDERCAAAVEATSGEVLIWKQKICDAVFHTCCGGHGEDKDKIWNTPAEAVLNGRLDAPQARRRRVRPKLEDEAVLKNWILDPPDYCFCQVRDTEIHGLAERSQKYFRWKEVVGRNELEEIIREKTGIDLGMLYEIVPIRRGRSGRIIELELIGSRRNLRLLKELKIREALSRTRLLSSCFTIIAETDEHGQALRFTLLGAGSGHGCGMCQVGAAAQAEQGAGYQEILEHYYPNTSLQQIYTLD